MERKLIAYLFWMENILDAGGRMRSGKSVGALLSILLVGSIFSLSACQSVKIPSGGNSGAAGTGTTATAPQGGPIAGNWQVSYSVSGETQSAHMTLAQSGNKFEGSGTDDKDGQTFVIDSGLFSGKSVIFHKRYHVDENPNLPPIVYQGTFEMANTPTYSGPYMNGTYKLNKGGQVIDGQWDAQVDNGTAPTTAATTKSPPPQPENPPINTNRRPDLSGKWDAGYEFEFKTVHSSMFIEQVGQKVTGHGIDKATKEAFKIEGTYKFPELKMYVTYFPVKGPKGKSKPERKLEFRGTASVVNEADFQGTRLDGKTNGGGMWMAEQVR
jgi:hypothetical protein